MTGIDVRDRLCTHFETVESHDFCICHLTFLKSEHCSQGTGNCVENHKHREIHLQHVSDRGVSLEKQGSRKHDVKYVYTIVTPVIDY